MEEEEEVNVSMAEWLSAFPPPFTDAVLNGLKCTVSTKKFLKEFLEVLFGNDWRLLDQFLLEQCKEPFSKCNVFDCEREKHSYSWKTALLHW